MIFRLSRSGAEALTIRVSSCYVFNQWHNGRAQIDLRKQVLIALKYFGHQEGNRSLAQLFDVSVSTVSRVIQRFCDAIMSIAEDIIKWPSITEQRAIADGFSLISRLPSLCVGAIDCRENPILKPSHSPECYFNRKGYYSIKIQAVCDSSTKFIDVEVGWPGKSHDGRAFKNSKIYSRLENDSRTIGDDFFLIGDSAYPNKRFILTPYKDHGNLSAMKRNFNREHSRARQSIECAFGRTVERFRRLKFLHVQKIEDGITICIVACALHNFCIMHNEESFSASTALNESPPSFNIFTDDVTGAEKRDAIASFMMQ